MNLKRGMQEWHENAIKLQLKAYLNRPMLPKVPRVYGHVRSNEVPWGMLGNAQYADCVLAGAAHEVMVHALATERTLPRFNDAGIVQQYLQLSGGKDEGLDPIDTAKWRVKTGLVDADGVVHQVKAFASVSNDPDLDIAAYIFGTCGVGFYLPKSAETEFAKARPWTDTSGSPSDGHYVPLVGRNSKGMRIVVTWGRLQAVTDEFWAKYFVGGVAYISQEYMLATGLSPEGIDMATLDADLAALS